MSYIQCWVDRKIDVGPLIGITDPVPYYVADLANVTYSYDGRVTAGEWVSDKQAIDQDAGTICPDQSSCKDQCALKNDSGLVSTLEGRKQADEGSINAHNIQIADLKIEIQQITNVLNGNMPNVK